MRLLLVIMTALAASTQRTTHGLLSSRRSLATTYPACTAAQSKTFTDNLGAVSSGCANATSYDWDGNDDPSDTQRTELCKCTVSAFSVPKCHWTKQDIYDVSVLEHFNFAYNCSSISGKATPSVTEVDAASYTPAPAPVPATTTVTPTTSTSGSSKATETLPDCTVQQLSAFTSALYTASGGCMGGTASSYNWGGNANPTDAQYTEICKCAAVTAFTIPACSIEKGPDPVVLSVHYNWVTTVQCPTFSPSKAASSSSSSSSSSNVGMIAGIAGAVVVVVLIIAFVLCKRNRKSKQDQPIQQQHNNMDAVRSPVNYQPIGVTPHNKRKSTDHRPSGLSDGARTTISTTNGSLQPSGTGSSGSKGAVRMTETATWDDPVITAVRIPYDSIFFGGLLSRGGFGEVYRGSYKGETVAIKQLLPARRKDLAQIEQFLQEVKLVSTLDHERIVKFIGVAWNSLSDACLVVEFMENGDLRSVLTRWDSGPEKRMNGFDEDKVRIALHIAHALVYLHSLQPVMVHRDLKSTNILLDGNMDAKLTDFGVSRERADSTMTAGVGSSLWMAPEVMMGNRYDEKADIFSFGVVLSELDTHQLPYFHARVSESGQKIPEAAILQQVMLGRVTVGFTDRADPELVQLGRECVSLDPKARPTTAMVLHRVHQVMQGWHRGMAL